MMASDLPPELALLPFVESAYNPSARSPNGASGLWQITPATANLLGLKRNQWYDGRNDIIRSTDAAIAYLSYLNRKFDGDWLLSLAAYNSGEGTVARAISANQARGKNADFWALNLPRQHALSCQNSLPWREFSRIRIRCKTWTSPARQSHRHCKRSFSPPDQLGAGCTTRGHRLRTHQASEYRPQAGVTPPEGPHRLVLPDAAAERLLAAVAATQ